MALVATLGALVLGHARPPGLERYGPGGYFGLALGTVLFRGIGQAAGPTALVASVAVLRIVADLDLRALLSRFWAWLRERPDEDGATAVLERPARASRGARRAPVAPEADADDDEEEEAEEEDDAEEGGEDEPEAPAADAPASPAATAAATPAAVAAPRAAPAPPPRRPKRPEKRGEYRFPPLTLLTPGEFTDPESVRDEVQRNAVALEEALASFGIEARVVSHLRGPVITFFEIKVPSGVRLSRVTALADDIAIALKASSIRIVAPIPGRSTVGIEVPNQKRDTVALRDLLEESGDSSERKAIPILLGRDTAGRPIIEDMASLPHALIAGATGSGKSVCINAILLSILYSRGPDEVNLILVDPKQVELSFYEGIPHLITPVVTEMKRAAKILEWAVERMEERYAQLLAAGVRNIGGYNALGAEKMAAARERTGLDAEALPDHLPYVVIVVDELADLILTVGKEVEIAITRLAQKSRAVGIHIVLATQRPSTNVITGLIKANMPTRVSFVVSSKVDSRVVLDANGAERLLGMGDMLYMHPRTLHLRRAQCTLVTDAEARATVDFLKKHYPQVEYDDILKQAPGDLGDPMQEDDLYDDAVRAVLSSNLGSASMLQRRLGIGYTRASRLIDMMCDHAVVGPHQGSKSREVLVTLEQWEAQRAEQRAVPASAPIEPYDPTDPPAVDESWD
jgi:S-DNA-T family DNA segregation ATPase FtsK/SpoIIIE